MIADFFRWSWPRRYLLKIWKRMPNGPRKERLADFLLPSDAVIAFPENGN